MDRHSELYPRVVATVFLARTGERVPSPTEWARENKVRKDDVIRVYRALVEDGMLVPGEGRGIYVRNRGNGALARWRPGPIRGPEPEA